MSKVTPNNGWGAAPKGTYEHRRDVRCANGKLLHNGSHLATAQNDGNTVTLSLAGGETYNGGIGWQLRQLHRQYRASIACGPRPSLATLLSRSRFVGEVDSLPGPGVRTTTKRVS